MAQKLRQSTEVKVRVGPLVSHSDGKTKVTGFSLATADQAELLKHDGAATVDISGATFTDVTGSAGMYDLTFTTSHTDTVGLLDIDIADVDAILPYGKSFDVVSQHWYDARTGADTLNTDPIALDGSAANMDLLVAGVSALVTGTATATTLSTIAMSTDLTEATDDHYIGRVIVWRTGVLAGQATDITDYDGTTKTLSFTATTEAPGAGDTFTIH